jgi:hypothetical protein
VLGPPDGRLAGCEPFWSRECAHFGAFQNGFVESAIDNTARRVARTSLQFRSGPAGVI